MDLSVYSVGESERMKIPERLKGKISLFSMYLVIFVGEESGSLCVSGECSVERGLNFYGGVRGRFFGEEDKDQQIQVAK
ncbi:hypothetical protein COLO4_05038 [Corchorus olitorius]|uniref:Uncharacterized protein n=1 Tax=Corchorus olitorius TaxID=93759 RepID=A0A1R3KS25_9ROSI|nr:hypothetical protein COLO4_05038 [Corchorus olitorius]